MFKKPISLLFYGNYFYGICAVALSVEASLQQQVSLNSIYYYLLLFSATVVYYTYAYSGESSNRKYINARTVWYKQHQKLVTQSQWLFTVLTVISMLLILKNFLPGILHLTLFEWSLICSVPVVAAMYYGIILSPKLKINLRNNGWLKPFVIGFVWAGTVTVYPVIFQQMETGQHHLLSLFSFWLLVKNWMYITMLCIMFDIKDYAADHNHQLKTFVVRVGLRKTIFYIIIPLTILGLISLILFAVSNHFLLARTLVNIIPFILLLWVAYSMHQRKPILYYLAVIDGLMLVKALCGMAGMLFVK